MKIKQQVLEALKFRHACKAFDPERVICDEDFEYILEAARLSPSSFGLEPWKFLVIQNRSLRERLAEHCWGGKRQFPTASHLLVTLVRKSHFMKHDSDYVDKFMSEVQKLPEEAKSMKMDFYREFQQRDFDLLASERAMTDWAGKQTYIPLGNMMTAAAMIGIDSCPIEGFTRSKFEEILAEELHLDRARFSVSYVLAFGYRQQEPREKTRQHQEDIVSWYR
ncbi:NAD(P)H-dependent oxidoreductase [Dongshaea marina]|uniref:NAD(P)H-dependent oxidoreductase n=1 Tax=Dongshaea marina TaxID=2047966 RepID=UPI000D3E8ED5|nr:NAD(P)H-dependent oxidoreductase [Dongshaea marina]